MGFAAKVANAAVNGLPYLKAATAVVKAATEAVRVGADARRRWRDDDEL